MLEGASEQKIFVGPKDGAKGCSTVVGFDPIQLDSNEAKEFLKANLTIRLESEVFVILGNTEEDIDWFLDQISEEKRARLLTVYNPRSPSEVEAHEESLEKFLEKENGGLVTLGSLFNGMESARVVFIYENPYASHFRANYMRASVELILIDRNESGTEILRSSWKRVDVAGETALELELEEELACEPILSESTEPESDASAISISSQTPHAVLDEDAINRLLLNMPAPP